MIAVCKVKVLQQFTIIVHRQDILSVIQYYTSQGHMCKSYLTKLTASVTQCWRM